MRLATVVMLLTGCDQSASQLPQPGIYAFTATVVRDDCEPNLPSTAPSDAPLFVAEAGLNVGVPVRGFGLYRTELIDGAGSIVETMCGATRTISTMLVPEDRDTFTLEVDEKWTATAGADRACDADAVIPANDCMRSARVRYELTETCPADCRKLVSGADGRTHCGC